MSAKPSERRVRYLVFDVESVPDGALVSRVRYPGWNLSAASAVDRYRQELEKQHGSDFIPHTFHVPVALAVAKVDAQFRLMDLVSLDEGQWRSHVITEHFWSGWERYRRPTFVTFNGRTFDLPVLELAAFRLGLSVPGWFGPVPRRFDEPRNRYNQATHVDLQEFLTNTGATRFTGGLNLVAQLLGKPGKGAVEGNQVLDLHRKGKCREISDYCQADVLDTYFVFLRTRVLTGELALAGEARIVAEAKEWLAARAAEGREACATYLARWGDWVDPRS